MASKMSIAQRWMFGAIAVGIPLSGWGALYPQNTWLQVGPVAIGLLAFPAMLRRWPISMAATGGITAFLLLHLFAARWSYSFVPYDQWLMQIGGIDLNHSFGFQRNMFDRLVHFMFGLLVFLPVQEISEHHGGQSRRWSLAMAILFVLAVSAVYEIFEWSLTMTLAPADAGAYNGEQGEMFDSQKDMASATLGALFALPISALLRRLKRG